MTAKPPKITPAPRGPRSRNLQGMVFDRLTVCLFAGYNRHGAYWVCFCECGALRTCSAGALLVGDVLACVDCGHRMRVTKLAQAMRSEDGLSPFRALVHAYKTTAKRRDIVFSLSVADCKRLFAQSCNYCGCLPSQVYKIGSFYKRKTKFPGVGGGSSFIYNGIDRVDNSRGYESGNVVPCCKTCNIAKRTQTLEDFLAWIQRAAAHQNRQLQAAA